MKLWMAMEEIKTSEHAATIGGKMTKAQLAAAMAFFHRFHHWHAIGALDLACDVNMEVSNYSKYSTVVKCVTQIWQLAKRDEVNERVEQVLLAKYAHCQQFRLRDGNGGFVSPSCWGSLRVGVSLMQSHYTNLRGSSVACAYAIQFAIIVNK